MRNVMSNLRMTTSLNWKLSRESCLSGLRMGPDSRFWRAISWGNSVKLCVPVQRLEFLVRVARTAAESDGRFDLIQRNSPCFFDAVIPD